jgi:hypothetical protein
VFDSLALNPRSSDPTLIQLYQERGEQAHIWKNVLKEIKKRKPVGWLTITNGKVTRKGRDGEKLALN